MAIIVEEEKKIGGGWFGFGILFIILVIVGIAVYYLFFVKPDLINTVAPVKLQSISELARIQFNPNDVVSGNFFRSLTQPVAQQAIPAAGNASPFGSF